MAPSYHQVGPQPTATPTSTWTAQAGPNLGQRRFVEFWFFPLLGWTCFRNSWSYIYLDLCRRSYSFHINLGRHQTALKYTPMRSACLSESGFCWRSCWSPFENHYLSCLVSKWPTDLMNYNRRLYVHRFSYRWRRPWSIWLKLQLIQHPRGLRTALTSAGSPMAAVSAPA